MIKPWFEDNPELLEEELKELQKAGISYTVIEEEKEKGYLKLHLEVPVDEDVINLIATFPLNYPYFRPQVQAPEIALPRHQHPFGKNLCLIPRPTTHWEPDWTLASYLYSQLPKVLETGAITDLKKISKNEYEQAEPYSDYYRYQLGTVVFIDSKFQIEESIKEGKMVIGFTKNSGLTPKVALLKIEDEKGNILHEAEKDISKHWCPVKNEHNQIKNLLV